MNELYLFLVTNLKSEGKYDVYSSMVVVAISPENAKTYHPTGTARAEGPTRKGWSSSTWVPATEKALAQLQVVPLGIAAAHMKPGVVLASYHAG